MDKIQWYVWNCPRRLLSSYVCSLERNAGKVYSPWRISWENLIIDQSTFSLMIILSTLIPFPWFHVDSIRRQLNLVTRRSRAFLTSSDLQTNPYYHRGTNFKNLLWKKNTEDFQKTRNISQHLLFSIFQLTQHSSTTTILHVRPAYNYNPSAELGWALYFCFWHATWWSCSEGLLFHIPW